MPCAPASMAAGRSPAESPPSAYTGSVVPATARAKPSKPSGGASGCVGVARTGPSTAKSSAERAGARELGRRVARRRDDEVAGPGARCREARRRPVHAVESRRAARRPRRRSAARARPAAAPVASAPANARAAARAASPSRAPGRAAGPRRTRARARSSIAASPRVVGTGDRVDRRQARAPRSTRVFAGSSGATSNRARRPATRTPARRGRPVRRPRRRRGRNASSTCACG